MQLFSQNISKIKFTSIILMMFAVFSLSGQSGAIANVINDISVDKIKVQIYPNPTSDFLNIDLSKLNLQKPQLEIRSIIGLKMHAVVEDNGLKKYKVDVQSFPRGYYLVIVTDDRSKFQQTVRFSKK